MPSDKLTRLKERQKAVADQQKKLRDEIRKEEKKKEAERRLAERERNATRINAIGVFVLVRKDEDPAFKAFMRDQMIQHMDEKHKALFEDFDLPDTHSASNEEVGDDAQSDLPVYAKIAQTG